MKFAELQEKIRDISMSDNPPPSAYLSCVKAMENIEDSAPPYVRNVRLAFLGSFTIQGLAEICRGMGIFYNLFIHTYTAPYNQFTQKVLSATSDLYTFDPQVIYLAIDAPDILNDAHLHDVVQTIFERTKAHIVLFTFASSPRSDEANTTQLNERFGKLYAHNPRVSFFDFNGFLDRIGRNDYWYTKYVELGDMRLTMDAFPMLTQALLGYAVAAVGNTKKCVVLDLDNTLWQGIAGEDGLEGVRPDKHIQEYLLSLIDKGVILAINSKNNIEDAMSVIEHHSEMLLKKNNFAAWRINWESKEKNIAELAEELNLGTESFVFVDDDPFQRQRVGSVYPEIAVIPPEHLTLFSGFHSFAITEEDKRRGAMYGEERLRRELQKSLRTEQDFIKELALHIEVKDISEQTIARVSQLTQKTNQFNLTTRRYTDDDIKRLKENGWNIWTVQVSDRFGDYGIVGVVMVEPKSNEWRVDNLLLSCRVLGRGVENHIIDHLVETARERGARVITSEYCRSSKNQQTEHFWDTSAFKLVSQDNDRKLYHHELVS